jgi:uncharacterized protein DUF1194
VLTVSDTEMRFPLLVLLLALATSALAQNHHAENDNNSLTVDVELVLAVDVSYSMNTDELAIQREAYAQAIVSKEFLQALKTGPRGKLAVTFFEWSASDYQKIIIPWRVIDTPEAAAAVAAEIMKVPARRHSRTSISGAINFAIQLFDENPYRGSRRVIDISGNGPNNSGEPVVGARDVALAKGIIINGLTMMLKEPSHSKMKDDIENLDFYYEDCVIGGPNAFVMTATTGQEFKETIRTELVFEASGLVPERPHSTLAEKEKRVSCLIGEEMHDRIWHQPFGALPLNMLAKNQRGRLPQMFTFPIQPDQQLITAAMHAHFGKCWAASRTGPTIQVVFYYKPDGTYASPPLLVNPEENAEYLRTAAQVMRQLKKCPPLKIPKDKYDQVQTLRWQFPSYESAKTSKSN